MKLRLEHTLNVRLLLPFFLLLYHPVAVPSTSLNNSACSVLLDESMMHMHAAMSKVSTGEKFDDNFLRLMIPHHEAALDMAKAELLCGKDPAAKRLAQEIIADQASEIDLMKVLLKNRPPPAASSPKDIK